ncbi:MAG: hypothetical protein KF802_11990 [Bdellovibrionaceae bacterium]|nr:hypothetical protein [Pseudobdellovibrionaceae bacterium]
MKHLLIVIGALSVAALSGCGGEGSLNASGAADLTQVQSATFKQRIQELEGRIKVKNTGDAPTVGVPAGIGSLVVDPFAACKTAVINQSQDGDSDSIYDHMKWQYDCSGLDNGGGGIKAVKGTYEVIDSDPTVKSVDGGGYVMNFNLNEVSETPPTHYFDTSWIGTIRRANLGGVLVDEADFKYVVKGKEHGVKLDWSWRTQSRGEITPADMAHPYNKGTQSFKGFYQMKGDVGTDTNLVQLPPVDVTYKIEADGIKYEDTGTSGCVGYYNAGSYKFTDGQGNVLSIDYACTNPSVTYKYNGEAITGW